jgi:4-amino-4-deoxy-L-arabinose transferase-like glycosyltransferase
VNWWRIRRRLFWRGASHGAALCAVMFGSFGIVSGTGALIVLGVCFAVLTLTFGRRARP